MNKLNEPTVEIVLVTPDMAAEWLESNSESQRRRRDSRIRTYTSMMNKGQWKLQTDGIGFDVNGKLINGQHRLVSVVESGVPQQFIVARNLESDAFTAIDQNLTRGLADMLGPTTKYSTMLGATARLMMVYESDGDPRNHGHRKLWTPQDVYEYVQANHEDMMLSAPEACRIQKYVGGKVSSWHAFIQLTDKASPKNSLEFYNSVIEGADLSAGDPRLALRNVLSNRGRSAQMADPGIHLGLLIKAWNDWMAGNQRNLLAFRANEEFPRLVKRRSQKQLAA